MSKLSASKMGLFARCAHWTTQPWPTDQPSDASEIGTWYHAVCAWVIAGSLGIDGIRPEPPACLGDANEMTPEEDAQALLEEHPTGKVQREVAYCYSPHGTRHVGFEVGRAYGETQDDEIPATADVVVLYPDRAVVLDWKSGRRENTDRASVNLQLAILALCVSEYHMVDQVEVQLRYADGGCPDSHEYDAFSLVDVKDEVDRLLKSDDRNPKPGLHCTSRYCPIRSTCAKTQETVAEIMPDTYPLAVEVAKGEAIATAEHAASLWNRAAAAQTLLDKVTKAVKDYCDTHGPILLGDGKELAQVEESRETIEASSIQAVYDPVSAMVSAEDFASCVKVSVPKAALEKAVKSKLDRGQKTVVWQQAMDRLREAGKVKTSTHMRHKIRQIKVLVNSERKTERG